MCSSLRFLLLEIVDAVSEIDPASQSMCCGGAFSPELKRQGCENYH
jgi:hypothetical protein